ncbi:ATP synthase subunit I [Terribacillus saccharophilus]|uniref:ATP synthase subunit I n=1 Tax=Terribacillus saccharophilus TaxID=361277 RepID=UPI0039824204
MNDARQRKWMFCLLAIFVLGAAFTPYQRIFLGLLLGTAFSLFMLWSLQSKITRFVNAAAKNQRISGIGTFSRLLAAILAVVIALRFEEYFHLIGVAVGIATCYIVILIDSLVFRLKD